MKSNVLYKADTYLDSEFTPNDMKNQQTFGALPKRYLSDIQIKDVLERVDMDNSVLKLSNNDETLIKMMKEIIDYQKSKSS